MRVNAKAIIFDRDGVIIDTDTLVARSIIFGLRNVGIDVHENEVPIMAGKSIDALKELLLSKWNFDFDEFRTIQRTYFYDNLGEAPYFPQIVKFIRDLHSQDKTIALTTSAGIEGTSLILQNIGISNMFKVIVAKEDCTKLKPDPEPYIITAKKLGISPCECVVIEDSSIGVEAAVRANMHCIAIPNNHTKGYDFSLADYVAEAVDDIRKIINIS